MVRVDIFFGLLWREVVTSLQIECSTKQTGILCELLQCAPFVAMVRVIAPAIESAFDKEVPFRADVDPEMRKVHPCSMIQSHHRVFFLPCRNGQALTSTCEQDAVKAQTSTGYRDRVRLPLNYSAWGLAGRSRWGFNDSYPVLLRRVC